MSAMKRTAAEKQHVVTKEELSKLLDYKPVEGKTKVASLLLQNLRGCSGEELVGASIFDAADPLREKAQQCINKDSPEDRAIGAMLGMLCGDAIGARVEFMPVRYGAKTLTGVGEGRGGSFQLQAGQWTDDSSMGLCLADSILARGGDWDAHDCMHRFLAWWHCGYNNAFARDFDRPSRHSVGLGGNISASFYNYEHDSSHPLTVAGDKETSGNGSVMRLAAVPVRWWKPQDRSRCDEVARLSSRTTHQGDEAEGCCALLARAIARGISGEQMRDVLNTLDQGGFDMANSRASLKAIALSQEEIPGNPDRDWRWRKDEQFKYSPSRAAMQPGYIGSYAMDATAMALNCIWTTNSLEEAVLKAANIRGDADSVASVTGQLAGAFYGASAIPKSWLEAVQKWDGGDTALRAYRLYHNLPISSTQQ